MKSDARQMLAGFAPVLLRLSTVAWAGARSATRGSMLFRDGRVGRLTVRDEALQVAVAEDETPERVRLWLRDGELQAECTCGEPRCGHAVAAVQELQRQARQAQQAVDQQSAVLAAVRSRLGGSREPAADAGRARILSNLERLPLEAGVDMVALAWRQSLRHGPMEVQELLALVGRLEANTATTPEPTRALALRLLLALNVRKAVFVPLPEAGEQAVLRLVPLVVGAGGETPALPADTLEQLVLVAAEGHLQVAPHVAAGLEAVALRSAEACAGATEAALAWLQGSGAEWREVAAPTGRDRLFSALAAAWVEHGDTDRAFEVAAAWPPLRGTLQLLAEVAGRSGRADRVISLCDPFDPRGEGWSAAVRAGADAALEAGHHAVAARLAAWAFELQPARSWFDLLARTTADSSWPERRAHLVERLLALDDPAWLAERLAAEPDAQQALLHAALTGPLRERTAREALSRLAELDPHGALHGRCARLVALAVAPGTTARVLKTELHEIEALAAALGEPALLQDLTRMLSREMGDRPALMTAVAAVVGRTA